MSKKAFTPQKIINKSLRSTQLFKQNQSYCVYPRFGAGPLAIWLEQQFVRSLLESRCIAEFLKS